MAFSEDYVRRAVLLYDHNGNPILSNASGQVAIQDQPNMDVALSTRLSESVFTARVNTLGQKTMANGTPVTVASDQSKLDFNIHDGVGNPITSEAETGYRYLHTKSVISDDSGQLDAFTRLRVSNPVTLFEAKRIHSEHVNLFWAEKEVSGGTITYEQQYARSRLAVAGGVTDQAIIQTRAYFMYQPGQSILFINSYNFNGGTANVIKRTGMFDDNNGVFIELDGTTLKVVERTNTSGSTVDIAVTQSNWNLDTLDGNGVSGLSIDITKMQTTLIDYDWPGSVRFGFIIDGHIVYVHEIQHTNIDSIVYMKYPNLPVRYEIKATAASSTSNMDAISCMVAVEGINAPSFNIRSAARAYNDAYETDQVLVPLVSIRLKYPNVAIAPKTANIVVATSAAFYWQAVLNPTISGGTAGSWTNRTNSVVEYNVTRTGTVSGGIIIGEGFASSETDSIDFSQLESLYSIGTDIDGVSDELVLAVQTISTPKEQFLAAMSWKELV